jgi:hypothetical protein
MARTACVVAAASLTSSGNGVMAACSRASSASLSPDRAEAATFTPRLASSSASARPMPLLAPVIHAVCQCSAIVAPLFADDTIIRCAAGDRGKKKHTS